MPHSVIPVKIQSMHTKCFKYFLDHIHAGLTLPVFNIADRTFHHAYRFRQFFLYDFFAFRKAASFSPLVSK